MLTRRRAHVSARRNSLMIVLVGGLLATAASAWAAPGDGNPLGVPGFDNPKPTPPQAKSPAGSPGAVNPPPGNAGPGNPVPGSPPGGPTPGKDPIPGQPAPGQPAPTPDQAPPVEAPPPPAPLPPVPDAAAIGSSTKLLRQLFGQEIDAARNPTVKQEEAKKLLQQGIESKDDLAGKFVLLQAARDLAIGAADPTLALQVADELGRSFRIDALALKLDTMTQVSKTAIAPALSKQLADACGLVVDDAILADKYDIAKSVAVLGLAAAKKSRDAELIRQWTARAKDIDELMAAFDAVRDAAAALEAKPLDPAANSAVGRYRVLVKSDWDGGLAMLALGSDPALQALAAKELGDLQNVDDQLKLADGWWELAETQDPATKEKYESRAMAWYSRVLPNLQGLNKTRVEKRLADLNAKLYSKIAAALKAKRWTVAPPAGNMNNQRASGSLDVPDEPALVVGFDIGVLENNGNKSIRSIRPIFLTAHGDVNGPTRGDNRGPGQGADVQNVRAKEGFAVAGITVRAGNRIDGLSVTFMQIQGMGLNPRSAYTSDWYGNQAGSAEVRQGGSGQPVIGLATRTSNGGGGGPGGFGNRGGTTLEAIAIILTR